MILLDTLEGMQRAAMVLLVVYCAVAIILLPREVTFLNGVEQPPRRLFIILDLLIQLCILAVLVPCALGPLAMGGSELARQHVPWGWPVVTLGFIGMWITVIWSMAARYSYINQLLTKVRQESAEALHELQQHLAEEERRHD